MDIFQVLILPIGLGLLGFVEPCSIGASLLFLWHVERAPPFARAFHAIVFTLVRAVFVGALGTIAALIGAQFFELQRIGWIVLGVLYALLGLAYLTGRAGALMRSFGPTLPHVASTRGTVALGMLFGLNIPACAAPLLLALLGAAAAGGGDTGRLAPGFMSLSVFGLALSLPLTLAIVYPPLQRTLAKMVDRSSQWPAAIGILLVAIGLWSVYFGAAVDPARALRVG